MTRQDNPKPEPSTDAQDIEIIPLSPLEQERLAGLFEKPNLKFGGGRYANGFIVPDDIPLDPEED